MFAGLRLKVQRSLKFIKPKPELLPVLAFGFLVKTIVPSLWFLFEYFPLTNLNMGCMGVIVAVN